MIIMMMMILIMIRHCRARGLPRRPRASRPWAARRRRGALRAWGRPGLLILLSGKDKGGPSKGGFLNDILFRKPPLLGPPLSWSNCYFVVWGHWFAMTTYIYIYIYIYSYIYIYIYIYAKAWVCYDIYIYIYRERERDLLSALGADGGWEVAAGTFASLGDSLRCMRTF